MRTVGMIWVLVWCLTYQVELAMVGASEVWQVLVAVGFIWAFLWDMVPTIRALQEWEKHEDG